MLIGTRHNLESDFLRNYYHGFFYEAGLLFELSFAKKSDSIIFVNFVCIRDVFKLLRFVCNIIPIKIYYFHSYNLEIFLHRATDHGQVKGLALFSKPNILCYPLRVGQSFCNYINWKNCPKYLSYYRSFFLQVPHRVSYFDTHKKRHLVRAKTIREDAVSWKMANLFLFFIIFVKNDLAKL